MRQRATVICLAALLAAGCPAGGKALLETPPLETDELALTVKLSDLWVGSSLLGPLKATIPVPALPSLGGLISLPYLKVPLGKGDGATITVPEQARGVPLSKATLILTTTNHMAIPLKLRIFLAKEDPYSADAAPSILDMAAAGEVGQTATTEKDLDTTMFGGTVVRLGVGVSSSGSGGASVAVSSEDSVTAKAKVRFQLRII